MHKHPTRRFAPSIDPFECVEREVALYHQAYEQVFAQPQEAMPFGAPLEQSHPLGAQMLQPIWQHFQEQQAFNRQVALLRARDPLLAGLAANAAMHRQHWAPKGPQEHDVIDVQAREVPDGPPI
jgi:hypothetical protein